MIIDTSVLIDILRGDFDKEKLEQIEEGNMLKTTSITEMELWEGVLESSTSDEEKRKVEELLDEIESLSFKSEDGRSTARISHNLRNTGKPIDLEDMMIASIAINEGEKVITGNGKHFEKINDLDVITR